MAVKINHRILKKWRVAEKSDVGPIIRDFLKERPAYPYEIWRYYLD